MIQGWARQLVVSVADSCHGNGMRPNPAIMLPSMVEPFWLGRQWPRQRRSASWRRVLVLGPVEWVAQVCSRDNRFFPVLFAAHLPGSAEARWGERSRVSCLSAGVWD